MTADTENGVVIDPSVTQVTAGSIDAIARRAARVTLAPAAEQRIAASRHALDQAIAAGTSIYGVTTGLGAAIDTTIKSEDDRQRSIPLARAVGVGRKADKDEIRAIMAARLCRLAAGYSGASPACARALVEMLNGGICPVVPMTGSVGEADLSQLAHIALALVGDADVMLGGSLMSAREAFRQCGLNRPALTGKDGLALVSSNAASVGTAALLVIDAREAIDSALAAAALSFEGYRGNLSPFDPRTAVFRPAPFQRQVGDTLNALFAGGTLTAPGAARRLQDPLSFRCLGSVGAAALYRLEEARQAVELELNTSDDNPAIIPVKAEVLANANFDPTHMALSLEALGMALSRVAACTSERIMKLVSPESSGLPRFLAPVGDGRNGFATVLKTVSALMAGIAHRANPMPVIVPPVADRVEDYATMAPAIVDKTRAIVADLRLLSAIELMVASQAVTLRGQMTLGNGTARIFAYVRERVSELTEDRAAAGDIAALDELIRDGSLSHIVQSSMEYGHAMGA